MRDVWFSGRAFRLHLTLVAVGGGCLYAGWWQLTSALGGDSLSWVYTFEWPFFALYAVYMWWKLLHDSEKVAAVAAARVARAAPEQTVASATAAPGAPRPVALVREPASPVVAADMTALRFDPYDEAADPELAAYNRYLASLHEDDRTRHGSRRREGGSRLQSTASS